ncbi:MAG: transglycosylase SLT domain-containing protein, partial [Proteobacteria bacterium]|nr:transglycosylase SLT domain-containing protein [Pseudomonadota bacterium]
ARRFGLRVNGETDERFNPAKATEAATDYLAMLYQQFQDWPLAIAAYNCGEGAMQKALAQTNAANLAELTRQCRLAPKQSPLVEETLNFVPAFAAAVEVMTRSKELRLSTVALLTPQPAHGDRWRGPFATQQDENTLRLQGDYTSRPLPEPRPQQSVRIP